MCAVGHSDFLRTRSQELKDQSEKPQSGRRLMEREKHQEKKKKSLSLRVNSRMLIGGEKEALYRVQGAYKVNREENNSEGKWQAGSVTDTS